MTRLSGRVAVVTGGARGIGAATAVRLAEEGAQIAVFDLPDVACTATVAAVQAAGSTALAVPCDVTDRQQVDAAFQQVVETWGKVDVLVNNAGIVRDNLLFKMTDEDWESVVAVHLRGAFLCTRAAQRWMVAQRWGKVVNVSSTSALGNRGQANYAAAKAGLQGLTRTLAMELGPFNINVNAVAPGFIETEMTRATATRLGLTMDEFKRQAAAQIPLRRVGQPRDVAHVIAFLCSEEASFVNGQVIYVSGGP
ncbi:MAG: 3-oxoacyl-ACP reductase FabG [Alicyclobacillus sp.]|nr:3-oxoacyl-ACP reductase FabG [Alicyclobacillus sp.]